MLQMVEEVRVMEQNRAVSSKINVGCWKEGPFPSQEPVKLKEMSITNKPFKVISAGVPKTLKHWTEILEATGAELLLVGPWGGLSVSVRLVAGRAHGGMTPWIVFEESCRSLQKCIGPSGGQKCGRYICAGHGANFARGRSELHRCWT